MLIGVSMQVGHTEDTLKNAVFGSAVTVAAFVAGALRRVGIGAGTQLIYRRTVILLMDGTDEQKLVDLPPRAKLVFTVLEQEKPLT